MKKAVIIAGGEIDDSFGREWLLKERPDYLIAADSGMEFLKRIGKKPDLLLGDFDSVSDGTLAYFQRQDDIEWRRLNPVKDDTDTEAAVRFAVERGVKELTLLGATGSRLDHVLSNIAMLGIGLEAGISMQIVDANNRIQMVASGIKIKKESQYGTYVSLVAYSKEVTHVYLKGFKYPLSDYCLKSFTSIGISNEITAEEAEICFKDGILLVIESRD